MRTIWLISLVSLLSLSLLSLGMLGLTASLAQAAGVTAPNAADFAPLPAAPLPASQEITAALPLTFTTEAVVYLPLISRPEPPPPEPRSLLICSAPGLPIPDQDRVTDYMNVNTTGQVVSLRVYVQVNHTWVGDVTARVEHAGLVAKLFDRPGVPDPVDDSRGCEQDNVRAIFDDGMERLADTKCFGNGTAVGGSFLPVHSLNTTFFNTPASGEWGLRVVDESAGDTGTLVRWCLDLTVIDGTPTPPPPPEPVSLPPSAYIGGMWGLPQAYLLDCESRSAVDWARHWGYNISETGFFWGLPHTDNPETGFVGDVNGEWGNVPPSDYGVHAEPIAQRLRDYGLPARARKYMSWDDARAEIAAGRPVIVWILGTIWPGAPRYYVPSDGSYTVTAPYEHTMVLVGYDEDSARLLNRDYIMDYPLESFLDSWSALSNMGVVYQP